MFALGPDAGLDLLGLLGKHLRLDEGVELTPLARAHRDVPLRARRFGSLVDPLVAGALLHGEEEAAFGDAGYQGVHKRPEAACPTWYVALRAGLRRKLNPFIELEYIVEQIERAKASVCAKVEHPFRVLKRQFGYTKVRYRGLKNTAQIVTMLALSNLWMVRRRLMEAAG